MSNYKPNKELREEPLKRVLKSYIVPIICCKYQTTAVRVLWKEDSYSLMWSKRVQLESMLKEIKPVVAFISCITAVDERKKSENSWKAGYTFWIAFDWPEYGISGFENMICKKFFDAGVSVSSCKSVQGRGKYFS